MIFNYSLLHAEGDEGKQACKMSDAHDSVIMASQKSPTFVVARQAEKVVVLRDIYGTSTSLLHDTYKPLPPGTVVTLTQTSAK